MAKYQLRIETSEFKKSLDMFSTVINKKNALPILADACIRYDRERKLFTMTATNTEQWLSIECWRRDERADGGWQRWMFHDSQNKDDDRQQPLEAFCVNVDAFREAFSQIPTMPATCFLTLDESGGLLRVTYGKGEFTLPVESALEYPPMPAVIEKDGEQKEGTQPLVKFSIETMRLLPTIIAARVCSANDELRPVMNTVCVDCFHDHCIVVASDGHSLYRRNLDTGMGWLRYGEFGATESAKLLIPTQAMSALTKAFANAETITVTADSHRIRFDSPDCISLMTVAIEGKYPNYESVIPKDNQNRMTIDKADLAATLRRITIFSSEASNLCIMRRDGGQVILSANDYDFSRNASEHIDIINDGECQLPDRFQMGFKISTMQKLISCIATDNIIFEISDASRAMLLKEEDRLSTLTLLIMPMLVNE